MFGGMEGNMTDRSKVIFGNVIDAKDYNKALKSKKKFMKKIFHNCLIIK